VPEASVDEYGNSLARKNNIRASGQILAISLLAIAERSGDPTDDPLRFRVPRLHSPHDAATFSCGKRVHVFSQFNLPECLVQCPLSGRSAPCFGPEMAAGVGTIRVIMVGNKSIAGVSWKIDLCCARRYSFPR